MKTLILSDIHANAPALKAVLKAAPPCDRIVFLGDLANYGPYPRECVDILWKYDPICIMGNHDKEISYGEFEHPWNEWSHRQLNSAQLEWIKSFKEFCLLDGHILLIHGGTDVAYDILPNTPDPDIKKAFKNHLIPEVDQVWYGHYHYQIDRTVDGVEYHCIRPVGQHRDGDPQTGYSVYEDGVLTHFRLEYAVDETVEGIKKLDVFETERDKALFIDFLQKADSDELLKKDKEQMKTNEKRCCKN